MIANLVGGFVSILIGVSLIGPISEQVNITAIGVNLTGGCGGTSSYGVTYCGALYNSSSWGSTVLKMAPGFFALGILGIGIAVTYSSLRQAGIV
jgi:hypothetical protein